MITYILTRIILETLLKNESLIVVDCGSGGRSLVPWYSLGNRIVRYGFDPDEADCARLNAEAKEVGLPHFYYPICLAEKNEQDRKFYLVKKGESNSLYQPDEKLIARWKQKICGKFIYGPDNLGLKQIIEVNTTNLDTWAEDQNVRDVDFIKLDIQGAELEALRGGKKLLQTALGLLVEVFFIPVYKNQPLFADVDIFLRNQKFTFFSQYIYSSGQFAGRIASPINTCNEVNTPLKQQAAGQLFTADVLYLRDPLMEPQDLNITKILKLVCIAEICNQFEYSLELLAWVIDKFNVIGDIKQVELVKGIFNQAKEAYTNEGVLVQGLP